MNKYVIALLLLVPTLGFSANITKNFDNQAVLPTIEEMRSATWMWKHFADLPNMGKLEHDPQNKNRYMMTQTLHAENPETTITFYGTQKSPEFAVVESRTWGAGNTQNSLFTRLDSIKGSIPLKSNCNFKNVTVSNSAKESDGFNYETGTSLDFQKVYILSKSVRSRPAANIDLYVVSLQAESYVITGSYQTQAYTMSIITPEKSKLGALINDYGWDTNNQGKKVACTIS